MPKLDKAKSLSHNERGKETDLDLGFRGQTGKEDLLKAVTYLLK